MIYVEWADVRPVSHRLALLMFPDYEREIDGSGHALSIDVICDPALLESAAERVSELEELGELVRSLRAAAGWSG